MEIHPSNPDELHGVHVSSPAQLIGVFLALVGLTGLTVWASTWEVGELDVWVALTIAGLKAALVATYFMHLRYDNPTNTLLFLFAIAVVVLFLGLTLSDVMQLVPESQTFETTFSPDTSVRARDSLLHLNGAGQEPTSARIWRLGLLAR